MIPIKINGKKMNIPTRWEEITYKQYADYLNIKERDVYSVVVIFTGIKREIWEQSKEIQGFYVILNALDFITKKPKLKHGCPSHITIDGKQYKVPKELDTHTVKQYEDMRALLQTSITDDNQLKLEVYPQIAAVYLCVPLMGEYSVENWKATVKKIERLPYTDVIGVGNFFLKNLIELRHGTRNFVQRFIMIMKNWRQGLRGSINGAF